WARRAGRSDRPYSACRPRRALQPLGSGGASVSFDTLWTARTYGADVPLESLRAERANGTRVALVTLDSRQALSAHIALQAWRALRTGRTGGTCGARCPRF